MRLVVWWRRVDKEEGSGRTWEGAIKRSEKFLQDK